MTEANVGRQHRPDPPRSISYRLLRPLLFRMEAERAHTVALALIRLSSRLPGCSHLLRATLGQRGGKRIAGASAKLGREVVGHLGLAAGMDSDASAVLGMDMLGFSHVEVGTVTARPQAGNDRPRLWRLPGRGALLNRMGFNNAGAEQVSRALRRLRGTRRGRSLVIGANIGKSGTVALSEAVGDYVTSAQHVAPWCDYLVVNVSSPNTAGLRDLQAVSALRPILSAVCDTAQLAAGRRLPVLVKLAPDLVETDVDAVADLVTELGLAGVVATNTTIDHEHGPGGLSGQPLTHRARAVVARLRERLGPTALIIGVGGVGEETQARAMLAAGADLVQGLSAFVYEGPTWPGRINRALSHLT